jgi:hypothetical protein
MTAGCSGVLECVSCAAVAAVSTVAIDAGVSTIATGTGDRLYEHGRRIAALSAVTSVTEGPAVATLAACPCGHSV